MKFTKKLCHENLELYGSIIISLSPGSLIPPSSHFETKLTLPLAEIIFIGVVTSLGLVMAMALIVFNIVWRSNK